MPAGFDWWLLILGVVLGGGIAWLLIADFRRDEADLAADEIEREAALIAAEATGPARGIAPAAVAEVLARHRAYLRGNPAEADGAAADGEAADGEAAPG